MGTGAAVISTTQVTFKRTTCKQMEPSWARKQMKGNMSTETYLGGVGSDPKHKAKGVAYRKWRDERGLKGIGPVRNKAAQPSNNSPKVRPQQAGCES